MTRQVQCPICGLQFSYTRGDTSGHLLAHLHDVHSHVSVAAYRFVEDGSTPLSNGNRPQRSTSDFDTGRSNDKRSCGDKACDATMSQYEQKTVPCQFRKEKRFTATVETWWRGPGKLSCNSCGRLAMPLARRQGHRVTKTSIGALCVLGCWPICFLPCMIGDSEAVNLFCPHCNHYMGTYDKQEGKIQRPPTPADVKSEVVSDSSESESDFSTHGGAAVKA